MRLLVDASSLLLHSAGVKNYTFHWLNALRATAGLHQADAFPSLKDLGALNHNGSNLSRLATAPRLGMLYLSNLVDWAASGYDFFHCSNQVRRPPKKTSLTATIHDLTCWLMPEYHKEENVAADKVFANKVWKNAKGLIAVSEKTRRDAIEILNIRPDRIRTIHSGVPAAFFDARPGFHERPYFLFVGTVEPRKNIHVLLDAYSALRPEIKREIDLVIAGPPGWKSDDVMARLAQGVGGVRHLGYVPEAKLPGLFAAARAFVYPSLYEGFGFPVAQAMAARVPVIASDNSCLPEIAGAGAVYVDPKSPGNLTRALEGMFGDSTMRDRLAAAGRARAEKYRWETCAKESWKFFEEISGAS